MKSCFTKRRLCLILVVLSVLCSCLSPVAFAGTTVRKASLSATSGTFKFGGGEIVITVYNANKITAACPVSWVVTRTKNNQVQIIVAKNKGTTSRNATVTVYTDTGTLYYKITQTNDFNVYYPSNSRTVVTSINFKGATSTGDAISYTFGTDAYGAMKIFSSASWLSASFNINTKRITVTASPNYSTSERTATFTVYDQFNQMRTVTVKQQPWSFNVIDENNTIKFDRVSTIPANFSYKARTAYKHFVNLTIDGITQAACQELANLVAADLGVTAPKIVVQEKYVNVTAIENCHIRPELYHSCLVYLKDGSILFDKEYLRDTEEINDTNAASYVASDIIYALRKIWQKNNAKYNGTKTQFVLKYSLDRYKSYKVGMNRNDFKNQFIERDADIATNLIRTRLGL